jgi:hypothetical protein
VCACVVSDAERVCARVQILEYLDDDGYQVEPKFYIPVIPTALVNGADGIGTGACVSPCRSVADTRVRACTCRLVDEHTELQSCDCWRVCLCARARLTPTCSVTSAPICVVS